jgi:hypothetical protein
VRIAILQTPQQVQRRVPGAVIHVDDFPILTHVYQGIRDSFMEGNNILFLIENWYDDRDHLHPPDFISMTEH